MKDDPNSNILFVKEVEKHPELYASTVHGHTNKHEQELHWKLVAKALNETSANCKEKWKNLRSSLCRHLRNQCAFGPGVKWKRDYYLAQHMEFLIPYIKLRQSGQFPSVHDMRKDEEYIVDENDYELSMDVKIENETCASTDLNEPESIPDNHQIPEGRESPPVFALSPVQELHELPVKKPKMETSPMHDQLGREYFLMKSNQEVAPESADLLFLRSLLPEMQKMGDRQKLKFKMMMLNAVDTVLYSPRTCDSSSSFPVAGTPATHHPHPPASLDRI